MDVDAPVAEGFRRLGLVDLGNDGPHMVHHGCQVHLRTGRRESEPLGVAHVVGDGGGVEDGLAGDAASPGAIAAYSVALDQGHPPVQAGREVRGGEAGGTTADDEQIVVGVHP